MKGNEMTITDCSNKPNHTYFKGDRYIELFCNVCSPKKTTVVTYWQTVGGVPCEMCNGTVHPIQKREAVAGCERCEREDSPHSPSHFRCNHGAHCTRDSCW